MKNSILLVDDVLMHLEMLKDPLEKRGYKVLTATNGEEAMIKFQKTPTPIIITDLIMPKVDGMSLLSMVKSYHKKTEVIILTAAGSIALAVEAIKNGAYNFLEKPINSCKLVSMAEECFDHIERSAKDEEGSNPLATSNKKVSAQEMVPDFNLSKREAEVKGLIILGNNDKEIANQLFISPHTVKKHIQNIFRKTGVKSRIELIVRLKTDNV